MQGLQVIRSEGKSVLQDKKTIAEINNTMDAYLSNPPNDSAVNELTKKIREVQRTLFADIIKQDSALREKWRLLRQEAQETEQEYKAA